MPRVITHSDVRRAEMLDRAVALFVQRGYDNVSLNDLIADAVVSKGAFYHWFPSNDALIAALAERSANEQLAAVEEALAAHTKSPILDVIGNRRSDSQIQASRAGHRPYPRVARRQHHGAHPLAGQGDGRSTTAKLLIPLGG